MRQEKYGELDIECYICSGYLNHIAPDCPYLENKEELFKLKYKSKHSFIYINIKKFR